MAHGSKWYRGSWCDVVATTSGWGFVRVDGFDVICVVDGVEVWRVTSSEPVQFVRAASDGTQVRAIAYGTSTQTAYYYSSTGELSKGTAYGDWPVALAYESGDWVGYICRSSTTYTRWPFAGAEPAATTNPFAAGTNMGMIQIIASVPTWRESLSNFRRNYTVDLNDITFVFPMTIGSVTVGQSAGQPFNTDQIILSHDSTETATVFPMPGYDPHVAVLADGTVVVACRTQAVPLSGPQAFPEFSAYGSAAISFLPPYSDYDAYASTPPPLPYIPRAQAVTSLESGGKFAPIDTRPELTHNRVSDPVGQVSRAMNTMSKNWSDYLAQLARLIATPVDLSSIQVTGGPSPSAEPVIPIGADADVLAGTNIAGFPNGRLVGDTSSVEWDFATDNVATAAITDTAVTPGTYGDATHVGQFTVDQQGRVTAAADVVITAGDVSQFGAVTPGNLAIWHATGEIEDGGPVPTGGSGGWVEGLMRTLGDGSTTAFALPDVAESLLFASVAGAIVDPLAYTLTGSDDEITFDVAPGAGDVVTVNYVTASA